MTNEEYILNKVKDAIDEEYQKYLKSLNVPSKAEWLKMRHKEVTKEIKHKFNVGDIIIAKNVGGVFWIDGVDIDKSEYMVSTIDGEKFVYDLKYLETVGYFLT